MKISNERLRDWGWSLNGFAMGLICGVLCMIGWGSTYALPAVLASAVLAVGAGAWLRGAAQERSRREVPRS